jgi:hypothetical protein
LKTGGWRIAQQSAGNKKGKDNANEEDERDNKEEEDCEAGTAELPPLLLLPPLQASTPAPPLLSLIKQWQQWRHHGVAACGRAQ